MIVHQPPRDLDKRRQPTRLPSARELGIEPRRLAKEHGLTLRQGYIASYELLRRAHAELLEHADA